jgi:Ca2+-binding RTX toxin-like protein
MSTISIESKPVSVTGLNHLYLVFRNDFGKEFVIRGGPQNDTPPFFGSIVLEINEPIESSEDNRGDLTPAGRGHLEINLGERSAESVWKIMMQQAINIYSADIDYNATSDPQNSNSTVASILNSVGIDIADTIPLNTTASDLPGISNLLNLNTSLVGTIEDDIIWGYIGNDTLKGEGGNDTLVGNIGNDILIGGEGNDALEGSGGYDTYYAGHGDTIDDTSPFIASDNDPLQALQSNVATITVTLEGHNDAPVVAQPLTTQAGQENQPFSFTIPVEIFTDVDQGDVLTFSAQLSNGNPLPSWLSFDPASSSFSGTPLLNDSGLLQIEITATDSYGAFVSTVLAVDIAANSVILGTDGKDTLNGGNHDDWLQGLGGNDKIAGNQGNDTLDGGSGVDTLVGGAGDDTYIVDSTCHCGAEDEEGCDDGEETSSEHKTSQNDSGSCSSSKTDDNSHAKATSNSEKNAHMTDAHTTDLGEKDSSEEIDCCQTDTVIEQSGQGYDTVYASTSFTLPQFVEALKLSGDADISGTGNQGDNVLIGQGGANALKGENGNDLLDGGAGNDKLEGGLGQDTLTGGLGADKFIFNSVTETGINASSRDIIVDFNTIQADKIDLSAIDANTAMAGNNAFKSLTVGGIFSGSFANRGVLYFDQTNHILYGNNDTDAAADFSISLTGVTTLSAMDFVL